MKIRHNILIRFYKFILYDDMYIPQISLLFLDLWMIFITFSPYSAVRPSLQLIFSTLPAILLIGLMLYTTFVSIVSIVLRTRLWELTATFLNLSLLIWITISLLLYPSITLSLGAFIAITVGTFILYFRLLLARDA